MYIADKDRYNERMQFSRAGRSGIMLPRVALGLWHNFGSINNIENMKDMLFTAFDNGITYFDLANNYGPVYGSAEENFGRIMDSDLRPYRDEMIIATKAGWDMWPGPYGDHGSRKYLMASLDQSLKRMHLDYVDIFYHHRPDPDTPMEETMQALADIVKQGKALYVGVSQYNAEQTRQAAALLKSYGVPLFVNQYRYNMFDRWSEKDHLTDALNEVGAGSVVFSPLDQGRLTDRYLNGIPTDSRAARNTSLKEASLTEEMMAKIKALNEIAESRHQSLADMALAWCLRSNDINTVLIGASRKAQILDDIAVLKHLEFSDAELQRIEEILA